jgi:hypothetical protein
MKTYTHSLLTFFLFVFCSAVVSALCRLLSNDLLVGNGGDEDSSAGGDKARCVRTWRVGDTVSLLTDTVLCRRLNIRVSVANLLVVAGTTRSLVRLVDLIGVVIVNG